MKIIYSQRGAESPIAVRPQSKNGRKRGTREFSGDVQGAFSLETFATAKALSSTHEDAQGWLQYLEKFNPSNFWYRDANVRVWAYQETYDNWQDTYGMDAVKSVYHSGHGGMNNAGVFSAPLGADWGGLGTTARSSDMKLGNEQANYVFWSTCESLRVGGGHSPIRTWSPANLGFRMLFGYESLSVDSPNYGKFFWEEWNKGKSLSSAWLDMSWRIETHQSPAVVACGATQAEAMNRVFNERLLFWDHVSTNWWHWRWYDGILPLVREAKMAAPRSLKIAELRPVNVDDGYVRSLLKRYGVAMSLPATVQATEAGIFHLRKGNLRVAFAGDGSHEIELARPNLANAKAIAPRRAVAAAQRAIKEHDLAIAPVQFDHTRFERTAGGTNQGSGQLLEPQVSATTLVFKQVINGLPVVSPGQGELSVSVDNDGTVTAIRSSLREVERLTEKGKNSSASPDEKAPAARATNGADIEALLDAAWRAQAARMFASANGRRASRALGVSATEVPGSTQVGYDIVGNEARIVARRTVEADMGNGFSKRFVVVVPLFE